MEERDMQPTRKQPLFIITGASCVGKSTMCNVLFQKETDYIVMESDLLWNEYYDTPEDDYCEYRRAWMRLCAGIGQIGKPVVLCGCGIPQQFENQPERDLFTEIHYLALVCDREELLSRMVDGRQVNDRAWIESSVNFNEWFKENAGKTTPQITLLDTTAMDCAEAAKIADQWIVSRMQGVEIKKEEYYYHVISDLPKRKGEHIILDEQHPNRVHMRVYEHIDEVKDILENPQKYEGKELPYAVEVALRELALEKVRKEKYPEYPSRLASIYVSKTFEESDRWGEYFAKLGRPTYGIAKIKVNGNVFEGDAYKCFDGTPNEDENLRLAEIYWKNGENEDGERPIIEIIADGDIEIVDIVKKINANIPELC